jgi:polysaccharide export outer membrane protein
MGAIGLLFVPMTLPAIATPTSGVAGSASGSDEYILGAGDRIRLEFFSAPNFSGEFQVLPNGMINLPRVGGTSVQGLTLQQATQTISGRYRGYLTRPTVTVSLTSGRPVTVAIAGEVNRPGSYNMNSSIVTGNSDTPTLTRLIQTAEGITQTADLSQVRIRRRQAGGVVQTYNVNLWQLLRSAEATQDIRLQDGDSIYIPESTTIDLASARERTNSNIATRSNRPLRIAITGEVNRPGPYTILENAGQQADGRSATPNSITPSVTQALQISGGITQMADLRNITVRRFARSGNEQVIKVNFYDLLDKGDILQDLPLQDGDRIEVARATSLNNQEAIKIARGSISPDRISVNIIGEVERPGGVVVPPNTPLNQAILAAGGFNKKAKTKEVELVRLEPNGTVSKRNVAINLANGLDEQGNPALRQGDTVIVKRNGLATVGDALGIVSAPVSGAFGLLRLLGIIR